MSRLDRLAAAALIALAGCRQDMHDQPRHEAYETSPVFADGRASRPQVAGTVAQGSLGGEPELAAGRLASGAYATALPASLGVEPRGPGLAQLLARGRERYDIYCAACHGRDGHGTGIVVQRGFPAPPSFHIDRLRRAELGYVVEVIANGFGRMPKYGELVPPRDRWAIAAYLEALQLSQHATAAELPEADRTALNAPGGGR